jgi:NADH:ubiquinone oxidoreductase subunit 6 (subunit J)
VEITQIIFILFSALIIGGALLILLSNNIIYGALGLMMSLLGVAAVFTFAGADFLAVTQIMVYVGGVLTLMIFGIMLSKRADLDNSAEGTTTNVFLGGMTALLVGGGLIGLLTRVDWDKLATVEVSKSTISMIGVELLTNYLLPFEIVAILLLVALVGAAFVASKTLKKQ